MISRIRDLRKDALVKGSFVLLIMIVISNLLNYVFQVSMARFLGPGDYSVLAVLMSIIYIFSIPGEAIQTAITKYTSILRARGKMGKVKNLFIRSLKKSTYFALIIFVIYVIVSIFLSNFLNISLSLIILTGLFIFVVFTMPVIRGIMQGSKKFGALGINIVLESLVKVALSILFVFIGLKVYGAMGAVILGSLAAFLFAFAPIREILSAKREREEFGNIYRTNLPLMIAMLSIIMMYSIDIILARRFFSPQIAGEFAFVSLIGKVIIFVSSSIGKTLFPITSEEHEKGRKTRGLLKKALVIVALMSIISLFIYYFFPNEIIRLLSLGSKQYLGGANILFILGLAYSLVSLTNIIVLYKLSINKMKTSAYLLAAFAIIEIFILSIFNSSIFEFSIGILLSSLLIFLYSIFLLSE